GASAGASASASAKWQASDCRWGKLRKRVAHSGDVAFLHGLIYKELRDRHLVTPQDWPTKSYPVEGSTPRACRAPVPVPAARARRIEALLAGAESRGVASAAFVREAALGIGYHRQVPDEPSEWEQTREKAAESFKRVLADG